MPECLISTFTLAQEGKTNLDALVDLRADVCNCGDKRLDAASWLPAVCINLRKTLIGEYLAPLHCLIRLWQLLLYNSKLTGVLLVCHHMIEGKKSVSFL